ARGLALTLPITLVIGGLLMAADASFQSFVEKTIHIDPEEIFAHVAFSSVVAWGVLGYFRAAVFGIGPSRASKAETGISIAAPRFSITEHTTGDPEREKTYGTQPTSSVADRKVDNLYDSLPEWLRLGLIETTIVLGSVNLLFAGFLIFQLPYLFGGMDLVQQTPDFKLAEYARRGVTELIAVSILVLPILLSMHWLLRKERPAAEKVFRVLASVQIGLLFVIMISATQRLSLLTGSLGYGQTTFRFYAFFFLIWLALVFVWFGMTVLRGLRKQFAYGALWSALFIIAMLHYVNPDDYIVRANVDLMKQGRVFDAAYNASLSTDATPALVESLDQMSSADRETVVETLDDKGCYADSTSDLRNWNWSRSVADALISSGNTGRPALCR
ncbi:MAG: DUF4173 domain-containing protein, partial [Acidobacteriota bacterium]|nr:DUF4173 domain-containing protein [Acidobacteriota bacterium]